MIKKDVLRTYNLEDGSKLRKVVGCCRSPGVQAIVVFRFGHWLRGRNLFLRLFLEPIYVILYHRIRTRWGIEIQRTAEIGEGFYIGHSGGIVISGLAKIGRDANISHQIT